MERSYEPKLSYEVSQLISAIHLSQRKGDLSHDGMTPNNQTPGN